MSEIERVGVVGCGLMGSGIAEVCARAGLDVIVREVNEGALAAGRKRIEGSLDKAVRSGKLPEADRDAALARLRYTTDFGEFADRQLVVEAVIENEAEKLEVFRGIDKAVEADDAILATQHLVDPGHEAGHGHQPAGVGAGPALLQPRPGHAPGRADPVAAHARRRRRPGPRRSPTVSWASGSSARRTGPASS